jgi:hypothetical protein
MDHQSILSRMLEGGVVMDPMVTQSLALKILATAGEAVVAGGLTGGILTLVGKIQTLLGVKGRRDRDASIS